MEDKMIYAWGYNGHKKLDEHENKRYFTLPQKDTVSVKLLNCAPDFVGLDQVLISNRNDVVSTLEAGHTSIAPGHSTENPGDPMTHICQHEDMTYLLHNGLCYVTDNGSDKSECSIVKRDVGTQNVPFKWVAAGDMHTIGLTAEECLAGCITKNSKGTDYIFRPLTPPIICKQVSCGKEHVLLLSTAGKVYSFGLGSRGQLGHGVTEKQLQPKLVEAIETVSMATISCGGWHSAAISDIQDLYIWGWNESGQLGFKMKTSKSSNVTDHSPKVKGHSITLKSHDSFSSDIGMSNEKDATCLQYEESKDVNMQQKNFISGEDESVLFHLVPEILDLPGGPNVCKVSCGSRHSAAVTDAGTLYTWGWGEYGQLGHGDRYTRDIPTQVHFFTENSLIVTDVLCQEWNTIASTKVTEPNG